jgi:cytochrome c5
MNRLPSGALALLLLSVIAGCRGQTSAEPPIVPLRNMHHQDRYNAQSESEFFTDHRTMRAPVEDTVPRERQIDPELGQGRLPDDSGYVLEIPKPIVDRLGGAPAMLDRGQARYNIYCRPCHDGTGKGQGTVITRSGWQPPPPSFHQDRIRQMPDGQLFATISHGARIMPSYGARIPVEDRWAIVSYVRALQLSQGE